ncbi:MAG: signal peptidase II [Clostridiales bacterium]|nr:signal peptidase II [Clostridiales bacterium]HBM79827.1 signal peptidase II [Clostridiaceae bacterium]
MFLIITALIVIIDQVTKYLAYIYLQPQNTVPVINNFFYLTYFQGTETAANILSDKRMVLNGRFASLIILIVVLFIAIYVCRSTIININFKIGITLVISGVISNLIDKIRSGYVVYFIDFDIYPVFNFADFAVILGFFYILFIVFLETKNV